MDKIKKKFCISLRHIDLLHAAKKISVLAMVVVFGCLAWPVKTPARENSVSGGISAGPAYDSNIFKSDVNRADEWKSQLLPHLSLSSKGITDNLLLTYAPQFSFNHRRDDNEMVQGISFVTDKGISSRWKVTMNGNYSSYDKLFFEPLTGGGALDTTRNFLRADDATQAEIVRILFPELAWDPTIYMGFVISQLQQRYTTAPAAQAQVDILLTQGANGARQRYWTSSMGMSSAYEFADRSAITLDYRLASQDNKTGLMADHLEQAPSLLVTYQFNQQWRGEVGYEFKLATYDSVRTTAYDATVDNNTTNSPHIQIDFKVSPVNLLFWNYNYQLISFEGLLGDNTNQASRLGWRHRLNQQTDLTTTIGASYRGLELGVDERDCSLDIGLTRTFDRGAAAVTGRGVTAVSNIASSWDKLRRSWELVGNVSYQLKQELSASGRLSYGNWDSWAVGLDNSYDRFQFGAGLSYRFKQWFTLSLNYDFNLFETESITLDDFTAHMIMIRLAVAKELWRW